MGTANKTQPTAQSVDEFMAGIEPEARLRDARLIDALMRRVTGAEPTMWGGAIVGYGKLRYRYASGREGDWFLTGFSPRKANLTLYIMPGFEGYAGLMERLGRHKTGKACLYINTLDDIDLGILEEVVARSVSEMRGRGYGTADG